MCEALKDSRTGSREHGGWTGHKTQSASGDVLMEGGEVTGEGGGVD